jgi:predicted MFS family arabinose efflux permease
MAPLASYRVIVVSYTLLGLLLMLCNIRLSPAIEPAVLPASEAPHPRFLGLGRSKRIVLHLTALFALDSFAGGLIIQSLVAYWLTLRFDAGPAALGLIFFGINFLGGLSTLLAARIAARFGLINTMVWTHIPANVLLISVPFMPDLFWATAVLLARATISQMDVPTRQSYTMAVVAPDERSAAAGLTSIARTVGSAGAPALTGALFAMSMMTAPFVLAGALKIIYDLSLFASFRSLRPPEETVGVGK